VPPTWRRHSRRERQETKEIEDWCKNDPGLHENADPKRKKFPKINKREKERKERKTNKRIEEKQQLKPLKTEQQIKPSNRGYR